MRIALCGAHGVGKSTILKELKEKLPHYAISLESLTRKAVSGADKLNLGTTDESQTILSKAYYHKFLTSPVNYISSRHLVDVLAYTYYIANKKENIKPETKSMIEGLLENIIVRNIFDVVFYIPVEFEIPKEELNKEFREGQVDLEYQKTIDALILNILNKFKIKYILLTGSVEQRIKTVLDIVKFKEGVAL